MDVKITRIDEPAELHCHYPGEIYQQPVVLSLDLENGELACHYDAVIGNARPIAVYDRRILWASIPCLTAKAANGLMDEVAPLAQRVLDGATIEWDGSSNVGRLNADAAEAWDELTELCSPDSYRWSPSELVSAIAACDWYQSTREAIDSLGLTADHTDEQLAEMAAREKADARTIGEGYTILLGAEEYLTELRESLREQLRDELTEVAEKVTELTDRRDALIAQQAAWGDSSRAIGDRAGISHTAVQKIAKRA